MLAMKVKTDSCHILFTQRREDSKAAAKNFFAVFAPLREKDLLTRGFGAFCAFKSAGLKKAD